MISYFFSQKGTGQSSSFFWAMSLGLVLAALLAGFFLLKAAFAASLFFGLFFLFFILPVLVRYSFSFFLKFLVDFLMKKQAQGVKADKSTPAGDAIDVAYKVVK